MKTSIVVFVLLAAWIKCVGCDDEVVYILWVDLWEPEIIGRCGTPRIAYIDKLGLRVSS